MVSWLTAPILLTAIHSMRDRDVRNAIQLLLLSTNVFDAVWLGVLPEGASEAASNLCSAAIEPDRSAFTPAWDSGVVSGVVVTSRVQLTFSARHSDPQLRDELAELLLNTAGNALNGEQLGGLVMPQMTRFLSWEWQTPSPPERRIISVFEYQYLQTGWNSLDTSS